MRKPVPFLQKIVCLLCLIISASVNCATDQEHEALSRLLTELQYLDRIVESAKQSADHSDSCQFDYNALDDDLTRITTGIAGYLNKERREPRVIEPITGDFTDGR